MIAWRYIMIAVMAGVVSFYLVNGAQAESARQELVQSSTVEQVIKRGVLRVGMDTFVPWAMKDKNGELIGFEIDVAQKLAEDMGVKVEFVPTKWSGIIPALLTGKFDVIIGGMGATPERNLKVNFSIPYNYTGMSLAANKKLAPGKTSLDDFNKPDYTVVARTGSTAAEAAKKHLPDAKLLLFDTEPACVQELLNGRAHAFVSSAPLPAFTAVDHPDKLYLPFKETFTKEPAGFAVRKGDPDTLNVFDNWIRRNTLTGFLEERRGYWFTTRDWADQIQ